jgi:hypothetical protein
MSSCNASVLTACYVRWRILNLPSPRATCADIAAAIAAADGSLDDDDDDGLFIGDGALPPDGESGDAACDNGVDDDDGDDVAARAPACVHFTSKTDLANRKRAALAGFSSSFNSNGTGVIAMKMINAASTHQQRQHETVTLKQTTDMYAVCIPRNNESIGNTT